MIKFICDKCGKEMQSGQEKRLVFYDYVSSEDHANFDLCKECADRYLRMITDDINKKS